MSQKILITKFNYNLATPEFKNLLSSVAGEFVKVPGCQWKIWLVDEEKKEGGAVYLFRDQDALDTFKASPLVASVLSHPALSNFDFRETDIVKEASEMTKAPLMEMNFA
jgi:Putative mono-oxygenase ydhR